MTLCFSQSNRIAHCWSYYCDKVFLWKSTAFFAKDFARRGIIANRKKQLSRESHVKNIETPVRIYVRRYSDAPLFIAVTSIHQFDFMMTVFCFKKPNIKSFCILRPWLSVNVSKLWKYVFRCLFSLNRALQQTFTNYLLITVL